MEKNLLSCSIIYSNNEHTYSKLQHNKTPSISEKWQKFPGKPLPWHPGSLVLLDLCNPCLDYLHGLDVVHGPKMIHEVGIVKTARASEVTKMMNKGWDLLKMRLIYLCQNEILLWNDHCSFWSPLSKMGVNKINMWRKTGCRVGLNHSACEKRWIFGGSLRLERRCLDQPPAVPSSERKTSWRDEPRIATGGFQFSGCCFCGFRISAMFFHDVSLWRSCRFQCILEKRCWKKCWPTCFFSLSVLLESELVCEVWEDYLNKLFFDVVSESNWELSRTASWNQDVGWQ